MFMELVKSFNTANHKIIMEILDTYGGTPKFGFAIRRMYENTVVRLIIGKCNTSVDFTTVVKKGDGIAPVLFL